jgi:hypothetical protein
VGAEGSGVDAGREVTARKVCGERDLTSAAGVPDVSAYSAAEVAYRLKKHHHAGLIVESGSPERVRELLEEYGGGFLRAFMCRWRRRISQGLGVRN